MDGEERQTKPEQRETTPVRVSGGEYRGLLVGPPVAVAAFWLGATMISAPNAPGASNPPNGGSFDKTVYAAFLFGVVGVLWFFSSAWDLLRRLTATPTADGVLLRSWFRTRKLSDTSITAIGTSYIIPADADGPGVLTVAYITAEAPRRLNRWIFRADRPGADEIERFVERNERRLIAAVAAAPKGDVFLQGRSWAASRLALFVPKKDPLLWANVAAYRVEGENVKIWRDGDAKPVLVIEVHEPNVRCLLELLRTHAPSAADAAEPGTARAIVRRGSAEASAPPSAEPRPAGDGIRRDSDNRP